MKKILALVLALALILTCAPLALAEEAEFTIVMRIGEMDKSGGSGNKPAAIYAEEKTGIKINYYDIENGSMTEKVNIMFATGDLPDAFVNCLSSDQLAQNQPMLVALDQYLTPEVAPNLAAMLEKYPTMYEKITASDGHIYCYPVGDYTNPDNWGGGMWVVNKVWLDKVGATMPTTTEEFYEAMKAIKAGDPNGNGIADEIPVTFYEGSGYSLFMNLMNPWGIALLPRAGAGAGFWKLEDGKVIFTPTLPEFRAGLEFWHKMAAEGLLDVEGFTMTSQQFTTRLKEDVVASYGCWTPESKMDPEKAAEYVVMPMITASDYPDIKPLVYGETNLFTGNTRGIVITQACKDPEKLIKWFDAQNADVETKMLWKYGEQGLLWDKREDGQIIALWPEDTTEDFTRENMKYTYGNMNNIPCLVLPEELEINDESAPASATSRFALVQSLTEYFPDEIFPYRAAPAEKVTELSLVETDMVAYLNSFVADAVVNGLDDAKWETHLKTLEQYGSATLIQWYQDFVDGKF